MVSLTRRRIVLLLALTVALTVVINPGTQVLAQPLTSLGATLVRNQLLDETLKAQQPVTLFEEPRRNVLVPFGWWAAEIAQGIRIGESVKVVQIKETSVGLSTFVWAEVQAVDGNKPAGWIKLGTEISALDTVWRDWERVQ